jgi:hypothetical protein
MRGKAVKGAVVVASGELVITDKRLIFAGDKKSFTMSIPNIVSTTNYVDGFSFSDGSKTHMVSVDGFS